MRILAAILSSEALPSFPEHSAANDPNVAVISVMSYEPDNSRMRCITGVGVGPSGTPGRFYRGCDLRQSVERDPDGIIAGIWAGPSLSGTLPEDPGRGRRRKGRNER